MNLFVCSDIHGNLLALREVLKVYRRHMPCDFLCLGDVVGYGPDSAECFEELMRIQVANYIMGNHEAALIDRQREYELNSLARMAIRETRIQLGGRFDRFIEDNFKLTLTTSGFTASHGSPLSPDDFYYVFNAKEAAKVFDCGDSFIFFLGHTHVPAIIDSDGHFLTVSDSGTFKLEEKRRYVINPGSVGQPRDNDPRASCCFYSSESRLVYYYKLEYDVEAEYKRYLRANFPVSLAKRLFMGV